MKIFISYSRKDAVDFAKQVSTYLIGFKDLKFDVFVDNDSISAGDVWNTSIETNISNCDIFVVIVTYGALYSPNVGNEVLQAQREKKRIIPCFYSEVKQSDIKWGLNKIQGVQFYGEFELARNLFSKILKNKNAANEDSDTSRETTSTREVKQPVILNTTPSNGSNGVAISAVVSAIFDRSLDSSTVNANSFTLKSSVNNTPINATVSLSSDGKTAKLKPAGLQTSTLYVATVTTALKDIEGNAMSESKTWSFTTGSDS